MATWIIKTEIYDPDRALECVQDQRNKGYTAWIEDEHGKAVDEQSLRMNEAKPTKTTVRDKGIGLLVFLAATAAALGTLYLIGLWVDH
jgi:hypothetical protein